LPAQAAPRPPELVLVYAPQGSPPEVGAALVKVADVARQRGVAVLDLSAAALPALTAKALLRRGIDSYDAFRYDDAYAALEAALIEAARTGAADLGPTELSDLLLYRALVHHQRGDATKAWDDMVRAATVNPTRMLDALRYPPRVVDAFGRATLAVRQAERGQFVFAAPQGARLFVDGRDVTGELPELVPLPHGEHYVRIELLGTPGYGALRILAEAHHPIAADLAPMPPPTDEDARSLSRQRQARTVLLVTAHISQGAAPTLALRLLDANASAVLDQAGIALASPGGATAIEITGLATRLMSPAPPVPLPIPLVTAPTRPVYLRPWFWGAAGVAATLAVVLPLFLVDTDSSGVHLEPRGELPWP
jgi:hypothetical protein